MHLEGERDATFDGLSSSHIISTSDLLWTKREGKLLPKKSLRGDYIEAVVL